MHAPMHPRKAAGHADHPEAGDQQQRDRAADPPQKTLERCCHERQAQRWLERLCGSGSDGEMHGRHAADPERSGQEMQAKEERN